MVILSIVTDFILERRGLMPRPLDHTYAIIATFYRTVYGALGAYVTARLAPQKPLKHALIGAAIGMAVGIVGVVVDLTHQPPLGPHWYPIALVVLSLPQAWLGAKLAPSRSLAS